MTTHTDTIILVSAKLIKTLENIITLHEQAMVVRDERIASLEEFIEDMQDELANNDSDVDVDDPDFWEGQR